MAKARGCIISIAAVGPDAVGKQIQVGLEVELGGRVAGRIDHDLPAGAVPASTIAPIALDRQLGGPDHRQQRVRAIGLDRDVAAVTIAAGAASVIIAAPADSVRIRGQVGLDIDGSIRLRPNTDGSALTQTAKVASIVCLAACAGGDQRGPAGDRQQAILGIDVDRAAMGSATIATKIGNERFAAGGLRIGKQCAVDGQVREAIDRDRPA